MNVKVTARHVDVTEVMKEYAHRKARRLARYFDHARKIEVILDVNGDKGFTAEMIASLVRGQVLACRAAEVTAMAALDAVVDKMERQLTRFKEKLRGKPGRAAKKAARLQPAPPESAAGEQVGDIWW